jgi:hypothetical protein
MVKLFLLLLMAAMASATGQQNAGTGSIRGRVVDQDTGLPLAGVKVGSRDIGYAVTDSDGRYFLSNVSAGQATVWVQETNGGYLNMTLTPPWRVNVLEGGELTAVDFRTRMDGQISGRVLDVNGEPVQGARVSAVELQYVGSRNDFGTGELTLQRSASTVTDDRGVYHIDNNIFAGRKYWLLAQPAATSSGPLSDAPQDPRSRRQIAIPTYYPGASTVTAASPVTVGSLEHRTNVDIRMLTAQPYCLEATLHSGSTPAPLRFAIESDALPSDGPAILQRAPQSAADGRIRVCDLYRGSFRLFAATGTGPGQIPEYFAFMPLTIGDSDVTGLNVTASPAITVSGDVVWDSTASAPAQTSLRIAPIPRLGVVTPSNAAAIPGTFSTIPMLQMLRYGLGIFPASVSGPTGSVPASLYIKDVTYEGTSLKRQPFQPGSGRLRIVVSDNAATLTIRVNSANGQPAARTAVIVLPSAAQSEADVAAEMVAGWTDANGSFTATRLPPGGYIVFATNAPPTSRTLLPGGQLEIGKTPDNIARLLRVRPQGQRVSVGPQASVEVVLSPVALTN